MIGASPIAIVLLLPADSVILLVIGLLLHRKGILHSRGAALAWAILTVLPVFAGGWIIFTQR